MHVLGIDCGTERTGYGVIDTDGRTHRLVAAGVIRTSPKDSLECRLREIADGLREVIREHRPVAGAVEEVFHAVNVKTALKLAHVRGVAAEGPLGPDAIARLFERIIDEARRLERRVIHSED